MRKEILREATDFLVVHRRHRTWKKVVSALACTVVFCTTYALILPAITLEKSPQCEKIEHTHTDACYTQLVSQSKTNLVCTPESLGLHEHTDACMGENGEFCCGYSDFAVHEHDASCFDEDGNLCCTLSEIKAHTHDESCYAQPEAAPTEATEPEVTSAEPTGPEAAPTEATEPEAAPTEAAEPEATSVEPTEPVLTCDKEEVILHEHTEECFATDETGNSRLICGKTQVLEHVHNKDCFQTVEVPVETETLTCGKEEGEGAHTHSQEAGCYAESGELICQLEESAGHQHGPLCYGTWELSCGQAEHSHSELCMPTETAPPLNLLATPEPPQQALANGTAESATITPHKTIDAFRDGEDNPDTDLDNNATDKTDLYRLYLDAQLSMVNKPIDLLIVVDQSGSMHNDYNADSPSQDMTKENEAEAFRDEALRLVLNGYSDSDSTKYYQYKQNGLIYQFLAANTENQVAVVGFQGHGCDDNYNKFYGADKDNCYKETNGELADVTSGKIQIKGGAYELAVSSGIADVGGFLEAETLLPWTKTAAFVNVQGIYYNATNYTAGFIQAQRELDKPAVKNDHQKVILFLSDGIPTCHIVKGSVKVGGSFFRPVYEEHYYRGGNGDNENGTDDGGTTTGTATTNAFNNFIKENPDAILHTVSIKAGSAEDRLQTMATAGQGQCFNVTTTNDLKADLKKLMFGASYSELKIEDKLSAYVELHSQPDYKVTRKEADGTLTTLYENGAVTKAGEGVIKSVNYDEQTRTVTALFEQTYEAKPGTTVALSFNIQTSEKAYQEYAKNNGYNNVTGQASTDYSGNTTSSNQGGFYSNDKATVTYSKDGTPDQPLEYPHPVVQVATCSVTIVKTDANNSSSTLAGAHFALYRQALDGETGVPLDGLSTGSYVQVGQTQITQDNGQLTWENLVPGYYWLVETQAPPGYQKLANPIAFQLTRQADGAGQITGSSLTITADGALQVGNEPAGHKLPETGGGGTEMYTIGGLLILSLAVLLLYSKKKHGKEDALSS